MSKRKPEHEEAELQSKSMSQVLESLHGGKLFLKKLHRTHVPRKNSKCHGLALPKCFVEGNMGNLCRSVVLLTDTEWSLRLAVTLRWQRPTPEVVFSGGWKAFAASNNLVEGDQLVFNLSAPSQFHVYIFNADGVPKSEVPEFDSEFKQDHIAEERKPSVSRYFVKEEVIQEILGEDLGERKPSAEGSCGYISVKEEIQEPAEEDRGRNTDEHSSNKDRRAPRDHQHKAQPHPSFVKRLTPTIFKENYLEIPAMFTKTCGNRLQPLVKLQGVFEESAVCTVACRRQQSREESQLRLFLGRGWKEFSDENMLEVEQELRFTLVSDSYFAVRKCNCVNSP